MTEQWRDSIAVFTDRDELSLPDLAFPARVHPVLEHAAIAMPYALWFGPLPADWLALAPRFAECTEVSRAVDLAIVDRLRAAAHADRAAVERAASLSKPRPGRARSDWVRMLRAADLVLPSIDEHWYMAHEADEAGRHERGLLMVDALVTSISSWDIPGASLPTALLGLIEAHEAAR